MATVLVQQDREPVIRAAMIARVWGGRHQGEQAAQHVRAGCRLLRDRHARGRLQGQAIKCRKLCRPSPFAENWTQAVQGPAEAAEAPAEALRRLHAVLTGAGGMDANSA